MFRARESQRDVLLWTPAYKLHQIPLFPRSPARAVDQSDALRSRSVNCVTLLNNFSSDEPCQMPMAVQPAVAVLTRSLINAFGPRLSLPIGRQLPVREQRLAPEILPIDPQLNLRQRFPCTTSPLDRALSTNDFFQILFELIVLVGTCRKFFLKTHNTSATSS